MPFDPLDGLQPQGGMEMPLALLGMQLLTRQQAGHMARLLRAEIQPEAARRNPIGNGSDLDALLRRGGDTPLPRVRLFGKHASMTTANRRRTQSKTGAFSIRGAEHARPGRSRATISDAPAEPNAWRRSKTSNAGLHVLDYQRSQARLGLGGTASPGPFLDTQVVL